MVPNCVAEENELLENWVTDLMHKIGAKTINKDKYTRVAQYIKKELKKSKDGRSNEFHAANAIRKFNLDMDRKVLAQMIGDLA